jgi:hypothetical protein
MKVIYFHRLVGSECVKSAYPVSHNLAYGAALGFHSA